MKTLAGCRVSGHSMYFETVEPKKVSQVLEKKYSVCTVCTVCMVCTVCNLQSAWSAFWDDPHRRGSFQAGKENAHVTLCSLGQFSISRQFNRRGCPGGTLFGPVRRKNTTLVRERTALWLDTEKCLRQSDKSAWSDRKKPQVLDREQGFGYVENRALVDREQLFGRLDREKPFKQTESRAFVRQKRAPSGKEQLVGQTQQGSLVKKRTALSLDKKSAWLDTEQRYGRQRTALWLERLHHFGQTGKKPPWLGKEQRLR